MTCYTNFRLNRFAEVHLVFMFNILGWNRFAEVRLVLFMSFWFVFLITMYR